MLPPLTRTIRGRFVLISAVFILITASAAVYTRNLVIDALTDIDHYQHTYNQQQQALVNLSSELQELESALILYTVLQEPGSENRLEESMNRIDWRMSEVERLSDTEGDESVYGLVSNLHRLILRLHTEVDTLTQLVTDRESRFPALQTMFNTLHPNQTRVMAATERVINECLREEECADIHLWYQLRDLWLRRALELRLLLINLAIYSDQSANHDNILLYNHEIEKTYQALSGSDSAKTMITQEAMQVINGAKQAYRNGIDELLTITTQSQWRSDLVFVRDRVQPLLSEINRLNLETKSFIISQFNKLVERSHQTATMFQGIFWVFTAVIIAALLFAYFTFIRTIYRPLRSISNAMQAAGRGDAFYLDRSTQAEEIALVRDSFDTMQRQIRSREARLESILENVSDGIITIDSQGNIETFNRSAEQLFGYRRDEVLGKNVTILMPGAMRSMHRQVIDNYEVSGPRGKVIDHEREELALRKDGSTFPMAIKVNEMLLEGNRYFTAVVSDISERKAAMDKLQELAERDSLTGLYNRHYFTEVLGHTVERMVRGDIRIALLYIDLDNFKYVNDTLGHRAGDALLVEVTELLEQRIRRSDLFARLGGDEFAVLLFDVDRKTALAIAEEIRQRLDEYQFKYQGKVVDIGCSIGIALGEEGIDNKDDLLSRADLACHLAKREGRNRIHTFDIHNQEDMEGMSLDMGWAARIRTALEQEHFTLVFQPVADLRSNRYSAYEVLLRMEDEEGGLMSPAAFMPAAERFGLMPNIDIWVTHRTLQEMDTEPDPPIMHINLAAQTIDSSEAREKILFLVEQTSLPTAKLVFEITETTAITHLGNAVAFLERLRELGCHTALDDFGTGYSSFAYLRELPVDFVKIDGSFVRGMERDPLNLALVKAMSDIAHVLGKEVIAEFVETEKAAQQLRQLGIHLQQGYLYQAPMRERVPPDSTNLQHSAQ